MAGCGIIPADAGSTDLALAEIHAARDHPRGRGEHDFNYAVWSPNTGIIPADAGSTTGRRCRSAPDRDHPRGRGEH